MWNFKLFFPEPEFDQKHYCVRILEIAENGLWFFQKGYGTCGIHQWQEQFAVHHTKFTLEKGVLATMKELVEKAVHPTG